MPPITSAYINGSGSTLTLSFGKSTGTPVVTGVGAMPTVRINGGNSVTPSDVLWSNPIKEMMGYAAATYPLPVTISPNDQVTVSAPAGCLVCSTGISEALVDMPVANFTGSSVLPQVAPQNHTMRVGWNVTIGDYYSPMGLYANWIKLTEQKWFSDSWPDHTLVTTHDDVTGMPIKPGSWRKFICGTVQPSYIRSGFPLMPSGKYILRYKNLSDATLIVNGVWNYPDDTAQRFTKNGWNYKVYPSIPNTPGLCTPSFSVVIDTIGDRNAQVELYDKHIADPTDPPLFHPQALMKLAGSGVARFGFVNDGTPVATLDDWMPEESQSYGWGVRGDRSVKILRFEAYNSDMATGGLPFMRPEPYAGNPTFGIKVICGSPHGLHPGQFVNMLFADHTDTFTFTLSDGTQQKRIMSASMTYPLDATSFVIYYTPGIYKSIVSTDVPDGAVLVLHRQSVPPPRHIFLLANIVEGMDIHLNIPHPFTLEATDQLADIAIATLNPGKKLYMEFSNEPWNNFALSYPQYYHFAVMGMEMSLDRMAKGDTSWDWFTRRSEDWNKPRAYYYICRAGQHFRRWITKWTAAGRSRDDIMCVMSGRVFDANTTRQYIEYADRMDEEGRLPGEIGYSAPIPLDRVSISPYMGLWPCGDNPVDSAHNKAIADSYDRLTRGQAVDLADAFCDHLPTSLFGTSISLHYAAIAASSRPQVKMHAYEGGPQMMGGFGNNPNRSRLNAAWCFEPRAMGQMLALLRLYDGVLDVFTKAGLAGIMGVESDTKCYSAYVGIEQQPGVGDGSDGKLDNRPYLTDFTTGKAIDQIDLAPNGNILVSPVGEAVRRWNATPIALSESANSVQFLGTDIVTQGNWKGKYGTAGYNIAQDTSGNNPAYPSYTIVEFTNAKNFTWDNSVQNSRALLKVASGTDRIASCWYNETLFEIRIVLTAGTTCNVGLYLMDWDNAGRTGTIVVFDGERGLMLDSRKISEYGGGIYFIWKVKGNIRINMVNTGPWSILANGLFFDPSDDPHPQRRFGTAMLMGA